MTENEEVEVEEEVLPTETEQVEEVEETSEDPLKTELDKVQRKGRTKAEKLLFTKKRVDEQLKELGIEEPEIEDDEDRPVTLRDLKTFQAQSAVRTSLQLADDVSNETERELLKFHLENTIKTTGNPQEDFELARTLVNAVKNKQIMEEQTRKTQAKTHSSGNGAPAKSQRPTDDITSEEAQFMRPPFSLTKEQIIAARKQ